jgi:hypothetical protein
MRETQSTHPYKKNKDPQNPGNVNIELQKLANESKHKSAKKKVNLANARHGKQNEAHIELLRLVESLVSSVQICKCMIFTPLHSMI